MNTTLFWNTYGGDLHWFRYSAASLTKFARGRFNHVACLVPTRHRDMFRDVCEVNSITLLDYADWPESSFNHHQVKQWEADILFPQSDAIFHFDADCVFQAPCGPEDFMRDGKLICPYVPFDLLLAHSGREGGWQWKSRADDTLGLNIKWATMTGFPMAHYRNVYARLRERANQTNRQGYLAYARRACPTFPHGIADFETLGAVAQTDYLSDYYWLDLQKETHPSLGRVVQNYSHGGLDGLHDYPASLGGRQTARQLFQRLEL